MVWLAVVSGIFFSIIAVAYRLGMSRGVVPLHILGSVSVVGTAYFLILSWGALGEGAAIRAIAFGLAAGAAQYVILPLMRAGLRAGPVSPLWCALMLAFVPIALYSALVRHEPIDGFQVAALGVAAACIVLATFGQGGSSPAVPGRSAGHHRLRYAGILVGMLLLNAINGVFLKELDFAKDAAGVSLKDRFGLLYLAMLYAGILGGVLADQVVTRRSFPPWRWTLLLGAMAAIGSIVGSNLLMVAASLQAAVVFPVNAVASIVSTAVLASVFLGERRTWSWYASLGCGLAAVVLANGAAIRAWVAAG